MSRRHGAGRGEVLNSTESGQVQSILQLVDDVLGGDVLGAYLHGSAVLGGLRPTSDLDILVVLKRRTSAGERAVLQNTRSRFLSFRDRCGTNSCIADTYRGRMREIEDIMAGRWQPPRSA